METEKKRINCCGFSVAVLYDERLWRRQYDYFIFNLFSSLVWPRGLIYLLHLFKNEYPDNLALSKFWNLEVHENVEWIKRWWRQGTESQ